MTEERKFPAERLRELGMAWLRRHWPTALIVPEFSVISYGGGLIDLAAVTESELIGLELKGEGDSSQRLAIQGLNYSAVATKMFLLPAPPLVGVCQKKLPRGWRILPIDGEQVRDDRDWTAPYDWLPTSPLRLLETCWADELRSLARYLRADVMGHKGSDALRRRIAETIPLEKIRPAVFMVLRSRRWETDGMRAKTVYRPSEAAA